MKYHLTADRFRIWLGVVLLATVALGSFWILEVMRRNDVEGNTRSSARSEPDYYVEKFDFIRLPNNGKANYHIIGDRLTHHPLDDNYLIQQPRINSFDADKTPVNIRAERALIEQKTLKLTPQREHDQIHLQGNVQVERPDSASAKRMTLKTEYLLLLPDQDLIKTDQAVNLISSNTEITAVGMMANSSAQQLQLLSKVRARFTKPGMPLKPNS